MRFGRSRVVDPTARRITACSSMKELTAVLNAQVPSWTPHHVELALTRWAALMSREEPAAGPILALMKNTSDPALMRALWDLAPDLLPVSGIADSVAVSRHDAVKVLQDLPAYIAAHVVWDLLALPRLSARDKSLDVLSHDLEVLHSELVLVMSSLAHACEVAAPEMKFSELLDLLTAATASKTLSQPQPLIALLGPIAPVDRLHPAITGSLSRHRGHEAVAALRMIAEQPEVTAHAESLRRAGAPGSFLELVEAASALALPA